MIENSTIWYIGTVGDGTSYKLAKYAEISMLGYATSIDAKVGLLRLGELMSGQFNIYRNNTHYWTLTPNRVSSVRYVSNNGGVVAGSGPSDTRGIRPSLNLKSNVQIVNGDGTKNNPFTLALQ